jgi:DNA-binding transcriptional LysR family regulator
MFGAPCLFRRAATEALDKAGVAWRVAFTGSSVPALWAAVGAGLGVTARAALALPPSVAVVETAALPRLGSVALCAHDAGRPLAAAAARLKRELSDALADRLSHAA